MGTPKCKPIAIHRDSLSSLVPKESAGRAPSHAPDSDTATDSKRVFVLESQAKFKRPEKFYSFSNSSQPC